MKVLVDTSAVAALILRNDRNHAAAVSALRRLIEAGASLVLTNFIVAETFNLLAARAGVAKAREWFFANTWPVERVSEEDEEGARRILEKYADKDFSYTDATTFALMSRLSFDAAFTYDRHFAQYGVRTQEGLPSV